MSEARANPEIGNVLPKKKFTVGDNLLTDYFEGLDLDRGAFNAGNMPVPSMIATDADNYFGESSFGQQRGHLWMRQEWDFLKPMQAGATYTTTANIIDIYKKRNRTVVNTAIAMNDDAGATVLRFNHHQSFLLDAPVTQVEFRDPSKKEGVRKFDVPQGTPLEGFDKVVTLEMCGQYFHGSKSYHTDKEASLELGFEDVVVGGRMTMAYVGHLLDTHFGERWFNTGKLDVKFTNPTWPNDRISMKGVATGKSEDGTRENVFAWIEKDDGTIVLIAYASVAA
jgi:acyl dehydratase